MPSSPTNTTRTSRVRYRAIVADFALRINRGDLPPGTRLPPERQLAAQLGVHRSTVTVAYDELAADGLVERRQGSGTIVRGDLWGVAPDWERFLAEGSFGPTQPILQRLRAAKAVPGLIDLAEGMIGPDLFPRAPLERALRGLALPDELPYPDRRGEPRLRAIVARHYAQAHGLTLDPDRILVTSGGQQAVYLLARALLRPGDAIGIEQPSYYYSLPLFQALGARLIPLPMDDEGVQPAAIRDAYARHRLRCILITPTYQNPTVATMGRDRRERLLTICSELNLPVVEDDGYRALALDDEPPPPLLALDRESRVIHVATLSKTLAPGIRVGWAVAPPPVIARLADIRQQIDFGMNPVPQWLVADLLDSPAWPHHLAQLRTALRARRDAFAARLAATFGPALHFRLPAGGLHIWARWQPPGDDLRRLDAAIAAGVAYTPGRLYGAPDGWLRLNYSHATEDAAAEAIRRLRGIVDSGQ
jgi:GntR family transcriptional regulator, regulator for abcA and norABC